MKTNHAGGVLFPSQIVEVKCRPLREGLIRAFVFQRIPIMNCNIVLGESR